jgi:hypothetical protein
MRVLAVAVLLVGCGSRPPRAQPPADDDEDPAPEPTQKRDPHRGRHGEPRVDPPPFRLIGLSRRPTWPLTQPPSLEPHFRVASPWTAACDKRGRLPDDTLAYLEAWCRFRKEPRFDLAYALLALRGSKVPNLADAVRRDIANRLADDHDAAGALAWGRIDEFLDTLLAVYIDLGRFDDANVIAAEIRKGTGRSCGREVAKLVFDFQAPRAVFTMQLANMHGIATPCGQRLIHLSCLISNAHGVAGGDDEFRAQCTGVLDADELAAARAVAARIRWAQLRDPAEFLDVADLAISALHVPDAEELALAALEATLLFSCDAVPAVQLAAARIQRADDAQQRHDTRRARLIAMTPERCEAQRK